MKTICFNCGQRVALDDGVPGQIFTCPACGATNTLPAAAPDSLAPESEREVWQQKRRRMTAMIAVAIFLLVALLAWLLLRPSAQNSAARQVKNAVFGSRVTEAAEQAAQSGEGNGAEGQGQGQSGSGQQGAGEGQQGQGNNAGGQAGEQANGAEGQNGGNPGGTANGNGQRGQSPGGAANNQSPRQNGTGGNAPPERSIGWLDRFFGTQERSGPVQAGEGGTGTERRSSGNTNATVARQTNEPVAAETTQPEPSSPLQTVPVVPPPRAPSTNRVVPGALNDNLEDLLRQHRAGSGDIRVSLMWNNRNDIDLHVFDPRGEEISFRNRRARSGGLLDIDMNATQPLRAPAVENVFWPDRAAPSGTYRIYVNHYGVNDRMNDTDFTVRVLVRGRTADFTGRVRWGEQARLVHQFTLGANN